MKNEKKKIRRYEEVKDSLPDSFCPVPFSTLILNPNGLVGCCREKGNEHAVGNIKDSSIEEIWNGEKVRAWRREFLTGNIETCKEEIRHNSCHRLNNYQDLINHIDVNEIVKTPILRLTPDFNGKCNLKCPFCDVWQLPNGLYDSLPGFWEHLSNHILPFVIQIDCLAGEPFIQKDFYKLIDLSSKKNTKCTWEVTTNGQWKFTKKIKEQLDKVDFRIISVSLDSLDTNSYSKIRAPGELGKVLSTISDLKEYAIERKNINRPFQLLTNFAIQRENVYEIVNMFRFCEENALDIFIQYVYFPSHFSPSTLDKKERVKILHYYFTNLNSDQLIQARRVLLALIDTFSKEEKTKFIKIYQVQTNNKILPFL
ncbi:SPASM domain-containing protein [Halobacteriovorax sp.]|uniref:SPASM domain-containing protein n=1 Tax=Halobacteriovorax sp. TaxID=2020862 RepID=UPI0035652C1B